MHWILPMRISTRLYFYLALSLAAIVGLVSAAVIFSKRTEFAAKSVYQDGFVGVLSSAQLDLLLERHARVVEGLPAQMDRQELQIKEDELHEIERKVTDLLKLSQMDDVTTEAEKNISDYLPELTTAADNVLFFAREFAQDKAVECAGQYSAIAAQIRRMTRDYRDTRLHEAQASIARVGDAVSSLIGWVLAGGLAAVLLVGPLGVSTMRRVLLRLNRITGAMTRLAQNDLNIDIPSEADRDEVGDMARSIAVFKENAVQLLLREQELKELHSRVEIALNNMTHGLCMFDSDSNLILCNRVYQAMYDLPEELTRPGVSWEQIQECRRANGSSAVSGTEPSRPRTERVNRLHMLVDGRVISVARRPMSAGGWVAVHEDVTKRHHAEAEVRHLARHDVLTDLPNRLAFREHLIQSLERGAHCAVHCIDLDHFKNVNDTLGHPVGDKLLTIIGKRLTSVTAQSGLVARLGGDEFAVVQTDVRERADCERLARDIITAISQPCIIDGHDILIGASVGLAWAPTDGGDPDQLLKNADLALYAAKGDGRGAYSCFAPAMEATLKARVEMEQDLRQALINDEIEVAYQPIICLSTGVVKSFEALMRWRSPTRGMVPPSEFIPLAEQTGLIQQLGEWILNRATRDAASWPGEVAVQSICQSRNCIQRT